MNLECVARETTIDTKVSASIIVDLPALFRPTTIDVVTHIQFCHVGRPVRQVVAETVWRGREALNVRRILQAEVQ